MRQKLTIVAAVAVAAAGGYALAQPAGPAEIVVVDTVAAEGKPDEPEVQLELPPTVDLLALTPDPWVAPPVTLEEVEDVTDADEAQQPLETSTESEAELAAPAPVSPAPRDGDDGSEPGPPAAPAVPVEEPTKEVEVEKAPPITPPGFEPEAPAERDPEDPDPDDDGENGAPG